MALNLKFLTLFVLFHFVSRVSSVVSNIGDITKTVGEEARFLWNSTASIDEAKWGLVDGSTVAPFFIRVLKNIGEQKSLDLDKNTSTAFPYKNRVSFIGNIASGRAWFVLSNLSVEDSKEYAASIKESTAQDYQLYRVKLKVSTPTTAPITARPSANTTVTSIASPFPNGTDNTTTEVTTTAKSTPKPHHLNPGEIVGIVIGVLVVIAIIVGLIVWYVKKSKNNGSNGSNNKSGPLEMDKPTGDGNRTSPEA